MSSRTSPARSSTSNRGPSPVTIGAVVGIISRHQPESIVRRISRRDGFSVDWRRVFVSSSILPGERVDRGPLVTLTIAGRGGRDAGGPLLAQSIRDGPPNRFSLLPGNRGRPLSLDPVTAVAEPPPGAVAGKPLVIDRPVSGYRGLARRTVALKPRQLGLGRRVFFVEATLAPRRSARVDVRRCGQHF